MNRRRLLAALLLAAGVLAAFHRVYWRPFDNTGQESVASFHAYGFAAASAVGLWPDPVVARDIDIGHSRIKPYPHWPNAFFLLFEAVLRVFGRTEAVGRSFAILGTLLGFLLTIVSLKRNDLLLYLSLPLLLLSSAGRDSVPFVFADVALYFWIGALLWITAHLAGRRHYNLIFRAAMLAALCSNHLIAPYAAVVVFLKWRESGSARDLLADLAFLGAGGLAVLLMLAASVGSLPAGLAELRNVFAIRSQQQGWFRELEWELRESLYLGPASIWLVAAAWLVVFAGRQWRTAILLPSFLLFTLLLREYVIAHHFARLPFVFFSLVTLLVAVELALERLAGRRSWGRLWPAARVVMALLFAARLSFSPRQYGPDPMVSATRRALYRIVDAPENRAALARCNAFDFAHYEHHVNPYDRIGQFFFGRQVVERVRSGAPIRRCWVDLENETVRGDP
ncbi:MAG TPA: hypothetical protein VEU62_23115 [Bryobacterales bacterium]|nr:hypothetical protein [Bryobacterales bacterium]